MESLAHPDPPQRASGDAEPSLLDWAVRGADGAALGVVVVDLRASYPKHRLVIEHGAWLWRHRYVVARAHITRIDERARVVTLDLDRDGFLGMPRW